MSGEFIEVEWKDLNGNIRKLEKVKNDIETEMERIMLQAGLILEAEVKVEITTQGLVDTGMLRMNWNCYVQQRLGETVAIVGTSTQYAPYLEKGTQHIRAYKFMEKAWHRAEPKILSFLQRELSEFGWG